jgi:hypothetical protein
MRKTGRGFFAEERNLNLMTPRELERAAASVGGFSHRVSYAMLLCLPSNLLLSMKRAREPGYVGVSAAAPRRHSRQR